MTDVDQAFHRLRTLFEANNSVTPEPSSFQKIGEHLKKAYAPVIKDLENFGGLLGDAELAAVKKLDEAYGPVVKTIGDLEFAGLKKLDEFAGTSYIKDFEDLARFANKQLDTAPERWNKFRQQAAENPLAALRDLSYTTLKLPGDFYDKFIEVLFQTDSITSDTYLDARQNAGGVNTSTPGKLDGFVKTERSLKKTIEELEQKTRPLDEGLNKIKVSFDGLIDNLDDVVLGTKSAKDALREFGASLVQDLVKSLVDNLGLPRGEIGLGNIFNGIAGAAGSIFDGIGGFVGDLFGSIFGGGRAVGGPVAAGHAYLVGERGPELLVTGGMSGSIIPNNRLGGSASPVNVNITNNSSAQITTRETHNANGGRDIEVMIDEVMARNIHRSGSRSRAALQNAFGAQPALALR